MSTSISHLGFDVGFTPDRTIGQWGGNLEHDYWIDGACNITGWNVGSGARAAGSTPHQDGAMLNPSAGAQGFDNRGNQYNAALNLVNVGFPIAMVPGDRLVLTESYPTPFIPRSSDFLNLKSQIVICCVDGAPPADAFRPPFAGPLPARTYLFSDIDKGERLKDRFGVLMAKTKPASCPALATLVARVDRAYVDLINHTASQRMIPRDNSQDFGRDIAQQWGDCLYALMHSEADLGNKDDLLKGICQVGLDIWGLFQSGKTFNHSSPGAILMGRRHMPHEAGHLLQEPAMMSLSSPQRWSDDGGFFHVAAVDVARNLDVMVSGTAQTATATTITLAASVPAQNQYKLSGLMIQITSGPGSGPDLIPLIGYGYLTRVGTVVSWPNGTPNSTSHYQVYGYFAADLGRPDWGLSHSIDPSRDNPSMSSSYRSLLGPNLFPGANLFLAQGIDTIYNHRSLFEYLDEIGPAAAITQYHQDMAGANWSPYYDAPTPSPILRVRTTPIEVA